MRWWLVIVLVSACSWSRRDLALEAAFAVEEVVDYHQTAAITRSCQEGNALIGPCGKETPIGLYFPMTFLFHAALTEMLPAGVARTTFQGMTAGFEARTVMTNYAAGY